MGNKTPKPDGIPLSYFILNDKTNVEKIVFGNEGSGYGGHKHIDPKLKVALKAEVMSQAVKGATFKPGREKGSITKKTEYIHQLAKDHPERTAKELRQKADKQIIGTMSDKTFSTHVTEARKIHPKKKK